MSYTKRVDWLEGSACDLIALGRLAWDVNPSTAASAVLRHEHLAKLTGFRYLDGTKDYAG